MRRTHWVLALVALASGLAACGEKPQSLAGKQISGSPPSWQGPSTVFTAMYASWLLSLVVALLKGASILRIA